MTIPFDFHNTQYLVTSSCLTKELTHSTVQTFVKDCHPTNLEISSFYDTQMFISMFTRARHWSLSWARWIRSTAYHPLSI